MRVFITGGTGYMGKVTVKTAREQGVEVTVLTRSEEKAASLRVDGIEAITGNMLKAGDWQKALFDAEYVIHLAAPPTWGKKVTKKVAETYQKDHYAMTKNLLESVNPEKLKKLIYIAGTSYFGDSGEGKPVDETYRSEPKGWGPYIAPSVDLMPDYVKKGLPIVTVFPGQVYGADSWLAQLFIEPLYKGKAVIGLKGYNPMFSPIHVKDCARSYLFLLEHGKSGENYNLVDNKPLRAQEITKIVASALNVPEKSRFVPRWLCQILMGQVLTEYATSHTNFSNEKLRDLAFEFLYPECESGLVDVVKEWKERRTQPILPE